MLFGAEPTDSAAIAGRSCCSSFAAPLAAYLPVCGASRVDPLTSLRTNDGYVAFTPASSRYCVIVLA